MVWRACLALADSLRDRGRAEDAAREAGEARALLERAAAELPQDLSRSFGTTEPARRAGAGVA